VKILVIACSLNSQSKSQILGQTIYQELKKKNQKVEFLHLKDYPLPLCDGDQAYDEKNVKILREKIDQADGILLAAPIYNFDLNAAAKNLVELTGKAWSEKILGFLVSAGGRGSYMAPLGFVNSMIMDFRCVIIPRFVYTTGSDFSEERVTEEKVQERIEQLADEMIRFTKGLKK